MIKHTVMWKLKANAEGASRAENAQKMKKLFEGLKASIEEIIHIEVGININHLKHLPDPYDIVLYSEFGSIRGLQKYQEHHEYLKVRNFVDKIFLKRKVVDYNAQDAIPMQDLAKFEYEQASDDWRHRDSLTWQIPAVLIIIGGVLVAEAFKLPYCTPIWIRRGLLLFASILGIALSVALQQNIVLQAKSRSIIESLNPRTERFGFRKWGSYLLLILSCGICLFLVVLCWLSFFGNL